MGRFRGFLPLCGVVWASQVAAGTDFNGDIRARQTRCHLCSVSLCV